MMRNDQAQAFSGSEDDALGAPQAASHALPQRAPGGLPVHLMSDAWRYDHAWRILNMHQELIRATDQKIYMLIVMSTLLVSFTANNLDRLSHSGWMHDAVLPLLGLAVIAFFAFALGTLIARHNRNHKEEEPSLVFFTHILGRDDLAHYRRDFHEATQADVVNDMLGQIIVVASILRIKLKSYRRAWICLVAQVAIFIALNVFGRMA